MARAGVPQRGPARGRRRRAAELVEAGALVTVPVLQAGGGKKAGIRALDVLLENLRLTREALASIDDRVITVGGDCGADLAPIAAAGAAHGETLTVLWFDAHPDCYTAQTLSALSEQSESSCRY